MPLRKLDDPTTFYFTFWRPLQVTLVGKGVCFDTGGLDIKSAAGMITMKKDMGGGAQVSQSSSRFLLWAWGYSKTQGHMPAVV